MELFRLLPVIFIVFGHFKVISGQSLLGAVENIFGLDDGPHENQRFTTVSSVNRNINRYPGPNTLLGNNLRPHNNNLNRPPILGTILNNNKVQNPTINSLTRPDPISAQSQNSLIQKLNQGKYEDDDVKQAAQQFPALQQLLDRLKELNMQKELEKQNPLNPLKDVTTKAITIIDKLNESKDNEKFKVIKRRKFYFQVLPVVPENERKEKVMEAVYYED